MTGFLKENLQPFLLDPKMWTSPGLYLGCGGPMGRAPGGPSCPPFTIGDFKPVGGPTGLKAPPGVSGPNLTGPFIGPLNCGLLRAPGGPRGRPRGSIPAGGRMRGPGGPSGRGGPLGGAPPPPKPFIIFYCTLHRGEESSENIYHLLSNF